MDAAQYKSVLSTDKADKTLSMRSILFFLFLIFFNTNQVQSQETIEISVGPMTFQALEMGVQDATGEAVIFLHGFPESSDIWRSSMQVMAAKGYYCLAPDQRGYSPKARPKDKDAYRIELLVQDVIDIADAKGIDKFHLVGHDWGSAVGWALAHAHPDRVQSWVAMSVPHIKAFGEAIKNDKRQAKKSKYMKYFQWKISERLLKRRNFKLMREEMWMHSDDRQLEHYLDLYKQEGMLRASLNWYRANYKALKKHPEKMPIDKILVPTVLIWGNEDVAVDRVGVEATDAYMDAPYELRELNVGHWLMQEAGSEVNGIILKHIRRNAMMD